MSRETGVVSDKDTAEVWEAAQEREIEKVRGNKNKVSKGRFTCCHGRGGGKVLLAQQTRRLGGK
jgi:hypothetical protein